MSRTTVTRHVAAPVERVFDVVADITNFEQAIPHIVKVEFLTEQRVGVGTRFRETRLVHGKEAATELEVTEYEPHEHVRLVADSHGCVWDSTFTTKPNDDGGTELTLVMEARPYKWTARLMTPLVSWMIKGAVAKDMDAVKAHCEGG